MASVQMRELINNILHDTTKDMREQADRVENAFGKRIEEVAAAKAKMENQLENVHNSGFFLVSLKYASPDSLIFFVLVWIDIRRNCASRKKYSKSQERHS